MLEQEQSVISLIMGLSRTNEPGQVLPEFVRGMNSLLEHTQARLHLTPHSNYEAIEISSSNFHYGRVYLSYGHQVTHASAAALVRNAAGMLALALKGAHCPQPDAQQPVCRETELQRLNRQLRMLSAANQAAVHAANEAALLDEICRIIVEVGGHKTAWVAFAENDPGKTVRIVAKQGAIPTGVDTAEFTWDDSELGQGPCGTAIRTGRTYICTNVHSDPSYEPWHSLISELDYNAVIALPLKSDGTTYGALGIFSSEQDAFPPEERQLLEELAGDLAYGINTLRTEAEHRLAEEAVRLSEARLQALMQLGQMQGDTLDEITSFALAEAIKLTHSTIGYLAFLSEDEKLLTMFSWSESARNECRMVETPMVYHVEHTGLWGEAVRQRQPIVTNDYSAPNPLVRGLPEGHVEITRHLNAPVFDGDHIVLIAGVANKPEDYDESDVRQLVLLMDGMWKIIQRNKAREDQRNFERRLEAQKRGFYRSTILSVTDGKLDICEASDIEPYLSGADTQADVSEASFVSGARRLVENHLQICGLDGDRLEEFMAAVGEALSNAVKHGSEGVCYVGADDESAWVAVSDHGPGIDSLILPQATLLRGFSTKPSMGLGYSIMLEVSDRILLHTGSRGTTVVLVKSLTEPETAHSLDPLADAWIDPA